MKAGARRDFFSVAGPLASRHEEPRHSRRSSHLMPGEDRTRSRLYTAAAIAVIVIGVVAGFAALDRLEAIFAPLVLALVTGVVLSPVPDGAERMGLPAMAGAFVTLLITMLVFGVLVLLLQPVLFQLIEQAPLVWAEIRETIISLRRMVAGLEQAADDVANAITPEGEPAAGAQPAAASESPIPTLTDALVLAPAIFAQVFVFLGALFFFSASRIEIYDWFARHLAGPEERPRLARRLRAAERKVSHYFLTISVINGGLGVALAAALGWIGLPNAVFWGVTAALLNFVLYLGPTMVALGLLVAGIASFSGAIQLAPPLIFLGLNLIEAQFVTPSLVGRELSINPLLVFLALVVGLWLWGPLGGIVAIPVLVWVLVVAQGGKQLEPERQRGS